MNIRRGFTLVELTIVMVIMVILLIVTLVNISSSQTSARDKATVTKAELFARALEARYDSGNTKLISFPSTLNVSIRQGSYPGRDEMLSILGWEMEVGRGEPVNAGWPTNSWNPHIVSGGYLSDAFLGASKQDLSVDDIAVINGTGETIGQAGENLTTIMNYLNSLTRKSTLGYESFDADNKVCDGRVSACVRFNVYYRLEAENYSTIYTIRSKHQ